jgi:hypothetical protein
MKTCLATLLLLLSACGPQESIAGKWTSRSAPRPGGHDPVSLDLTLLEDQGVVSGLGSLGGFGGAPAQVTGIWSPPNLELTFANSTKVTATVEDGVISGKIVGHNYVPGLDDRVSLIRLDPSQR